MDRMPWVVRAVGPDKHPRCTGTESGHGQKRSDRRGQGLTMRPDEQSNQAAFADVECCGAGCEPWSGGAGSGGGAYDRLNTWVWSVALVTCSRMRVYGGGRKGFHPA